MVKSLPAKQETWVQSLGLEEPLEKGMATHAGILAWRIPWAEESGGLPSMGLHIHRVEFEEVSGHRVLIKRGPGNRGPSECGTTHEATSGMSS